jgi:hypothetical protein
MYIVTLFNYVLIGQELFRPQAQLEAQYTWRLALFSLHSIKKKESEIFVCISGSQLFLFRNNCKFGNSTPVSMHGSICWESFRWAAHHGLLHFLFYLALCIPLRSCEALSLKTMIKERSNCTSNKWCWNLVKWSYCHWRNHRLSMLHGMQGNRGDGKN